MRENKVPVIVLVIALSVLIIAPILALIVLKKNNESNKSSPKNERQEVVVDFELSQLAEKAERLVNEDLAEALRQGDVPIDFMSGLKDDLKKADKELSGGNLDEARNRYNDIVSSAEARLRTLEFAKSARELKESTYVKLSKEEHLKTAFENTYNEAVNTYNKGLRDLEAGDFEASVRGFKKTGNVLKELKERAVQQLKAQLEIAEKALSERNPKAARTSFERVLEIDSANVIASEGLLKVEALEAIASKIKTIHSLRNSGENEVALQQVNALIDQNPDNSFLLDERKEIESAIVEDKRNAIIEKADAAEAEGNLAVAISELQKANKLRADDETTKRIDQLKLKEQEKHLEILLETGYNALKSGNYDAAKKAYEEALQLNPKSEEARKGLEKTSSLYLASIRYNKSIESAANYLSEGRIPLATKFFNEALESRPSTITFKQKDEEARIRDALAAQREKVNVLIISDGRTYVSLIGIFPPERFKEKEVMLYPDVYTIKGTRSNFFPVESEVKVNSNMRPEGIEIICTEKL